MKIMINIVKNLKKNGQRKTQFDCVQGAMATPELEKSAGLTSVRLYVYITFESGWWKKQNKTKTIRQLSGFTSGDF